MEEKRKVKGFSAARFYSEDGALLPEGRKGRKRNTCYGKLEIDFIEAIGRDWLKANNAVHEQPFKGSVGTFHVDFYIPAKGIAIETDPALHSTYEPVVIRDARRNKELLEIHGVHTFRVLPKQLYNPAAIEYIKHLIATTPNTKRSMDGWT